MKPFAFRLDGLLKLRIAQRDVERVDLAAALAEQVRLTALCHALQTQLSRLLAEQRTARIAGTVLLESLVRLEHFAAATRSKLAAANGARIAAEQRVAHCQHAVAAAERDVDVLEKLREQAQVRHQRELARRQVKRLDEVAGQCFVRAAVRSSGGPR